MWGLSHQGEVAELSRRWPILLTQARDRGDLYAVMNLSSYLMSVVRLAADDPDTARAELRETMAQWSRQGYHVQHNDALWAAVQIELYRGAGQSAWNLIHQAWPALRRSLLLRVQFIRTSMHFLRARAALAAAAELRSSRPAEARSLLAIAARDARRLEREGMPCPWAYAHMIRGGLAALRGDSPRAAILLAEAVERFEAVKMRLCSASVRRRLGELIGGDRGQADVARADHWMTDQINTDNGLLNIMLGWVGIGPIPWLVDPRWAMASLCIVSVWRSVPFATVILLAAMQGVPETVYEAAKIDGAGEIRQFVFITVPLIRGSISFVGIISIIHAFQAFDMVYVLNGANGGPETATYVLGIMLFQHAFSFLEFGYASALAWVMFAILLVLTVFQLRLTRQRSWETSRGLS